MKVEIDLTKYTPEMILGAYKFIFSQYIGGMIEGPEFVEQVPTPYIFGEICTSMRIHYLQFPGINPQLIIDIENEIIDRLAVLMNLPKEKLTAIVTEFVNNQLQRISDKHNPVK